MHHVVHFSLTPLETLKTRLLTDHKSFVLFPPLRSGRDSKHNQVSSNPYKENDLYSNQLRELEFRL